MMNEKQVIQRAFLTGERALFSSHDLEIRETIFDNGESPLKESSHIILKDSMFKWKYPLWYCNHIKAVGCTWFDMARAGVWYSNDVVVEDAVIEAPKNFRRCRDLTIKRTFFPNASETLWHCDNVLLESVSAAGDYFAMNSTNMKISDFTLDGNYSFDGCKNVEIRNARMLSRDAFWNSENITVYDSFVSGEYLGWNAKNLTLINCTIESLQGMCYIENLVMKNCRLLNTTLAFEYSEVDAQIEGRIDSVINPSGGTITADFIDDLILEPDKIDPKKTKIICKNSEGQLKDDV